MITITKRLEIDAGHRLLKHESKCRNVHGHRYAFEVECSAEALDAVGRIIDFGVIKTVFGGWLDECWDHGFLVQEGDPLIPWLVENGMKHSIVPYSPTAENIAVHAYDVASSMLDAYGVAVVSMRVWETPTSVAEYRP